MRPIQALLVVLIAACLVGPVAAQPMPLFGPQTFESTDADNDAFVESIQSPEAGPFALYLRNGDAEMSRVSQATVTLNGVTVVGVGDLTAETPGLRRPVPLEAGANELVVEVEGDPGTFVTLAIVRPDERPLFVHGRLVLAWGANDGDRTLVLALKNGSPRFPRLFRAVFFNPDGSVAGASERLPIPPRGSFAVPVDALLGDSAWDTGSIEVFFAGPGAARLFGNARQIVVPAGAAEIQPLEAAGVKVFRGGQDSSGGRPGRR